MHDFLTRTVVLSIALASGLIPCGARAVSVDNCYWATIGSTNSSGTTGTPYDSFQNPIDPSPSCVPDFSATALAATASQLGSSSSAQSVVVLQGAWSTANGDYVLHGYGLTEVSASANGALIPAGYYEPIHSTGTAQAYMTTTLHFDPNETYQYRLDVSIVGEGDENVTFGLTGERFIGDITGQASSNVIRFFRTGTFSGITNFDIVGNAYTALGASAGYAVPGANTSGVGYFQYTLSVMPTPLPAPLWLLVGGIGGLGVVLRRKSAATRAP